MQFDDPENPTIIEDFIRAIGAEPVVLRHAQRVLRRLRDARRPRVRCEEERRQIADSAKAQGAELLITACPLCACTI